METNEKKENPSVQDQELDKSPSKNDSKLSLEPESHLQSLGFTMDNGKARFKLDEDAPLYTNAALTNFYSMDADNTMSFVVLSKDSMDCIQQASLATYTDIQEKCMCIDYNSMVASLDSTEVHKKLTELLQENTKLKETLKQNNIAMKQQFNTLATWQEEIMKVHQNHKKKFAQTRELINYLKKENADLKMRLSSDLTSHTELEYEVLNPQYEEETTKEQAEDVATNELSTSVLEDFNSILTVNSEKCVGKQTVTCEIDKKVMDMEEQNAKEKQLLEEQRMQLNKEKEDLEEERRLLDRQRKNLEAEYKTVMETKELLQQERINLQDEKASLDQQSQLYETHYSSKLESEKQKYITKYNQSCASLDILHEIIESKETDIQVLQAGLSRHKETISLLETQLRTYEEDFRQERASKENLLREKCQLSVDVQKLIEFNEKLQEEIKRLGTSTSGGKKSKLIPPRVMSCPKCYLTFESIQSLENHVHMCLEC